jgi:hypothetical protein
MYNDAAQKSRGKAGGEGLSAQSSGIKRDPFGRLKAIWYHIYSLFH